MHPSQAASAQRGQELAPELVGLAVTDGGAQDFAGAIDGHPGGHHEGLRDHVRADADLAEGGVAEHVRELGVGQAAGTKRLDLFVQAGADPGDLRLGDPGVHPHCCDQVIDAAGGDSVHVGLHDHRVQRLIDAAAPLQQ
jgi:hypothetical protein